MIKNNRYDHGMTSLGTLVKGYGRTAVPLPFDLDAAVRHVEASATRLVASIGSAVDLGDATSIRASIIGWINQDDDAHEPCSLVACRAPLHPGPCKGWKGTLNSVAPGTYKQLEEERVAKLNARRVKKIADLKAQGKPIPRRLLTEIKPKPAPNAGVGGATATPLGKVNQQADLAGGQAHATSQAINQQAGVVTNTANLPKGPKGKKPTIAGRGPAFVITQPKVTDTYKLDKASKLTAAEWAALSPADKKAIRDELEAIKQRGFGPQQAKATALLAQLPAASTLGTSSAPAAPAAPQAPSAAPGKTTLGQASKTIPRPSSGGTATGQTTGQQDAADAAQKAASGAPTADVLKAVAKAKPGDLTDAQKKAITARLGFISTHPKASDAQKKQALDQIKRINSGPSPAPAGPAAPTVTPAASKPTLPSPGPAAPPAAKPTLPSPGPTAAPTAQTRGDSAVAITEAVFGPQSTDRKKLADGFAKMEAQGGGDIRSSSNFKLLVDRLANKALQKASAANMPGLGHGANDDNITTFNHQIRDHIADGKPGLPPVVQKLKNHLDAQKAGDGNAPGAAPQPNAPAVSPGTPTAAPSGAIPKAAPAAAKPTLPSPGPAPSSTPKAFPPHVQTARAVAGRAVGRPTSKAHVDAYGTLSKDDFDSLDSATQRTIRDDLANAAAKFLDPAKKQAARDLLDRFGSRHTSPAPGAPAVPANPKGYSDPQQEAVKAATSGTIVTDDVLKAVARLTPAQVKALDDGDRKAILGRLAFIATHPKAPDAQKKEAAAYGRIINSGSTAQASRSWDHTPSLGELHREEESSGLQAKADALKAVADHTLGVDARLKALGALTKAQFDSLPLDDQRRITDALLQLFHNRITLGGKTTVDDAVVKAITTYHGKHPATVRMELAESDFKAGKITADDLDKMARSARSMSNSSTDGAVRVELDKTTARIAKDNPSLPSRIRINLLPDLKWGTPGAAVVGLARMKHYWDPAPRFSSSDFSTLFSNTDAELNSLDPIYSQAIRDLRAHVLKTGLQFSSPWSDATKNQAIDALLDISPTGSPELTRDRLALFQSLPTDVQAAVRTSLRDRMSRQTDSHAKTRTWIVRRELEGAGPLTGTVRDAMLAAAERSGIMTSLSAKLDAYRKLDPADYSSLPAFTQDAVQNHLRDAQTNAARNGDIHVWQPTDNALKVMPQALSAHLLGLRDGGLDRNTRNARDFAEYGRSIISPESRVKAYQTLTSSRLAALPPATQRTILDDLDKIENDASLPILTRHTAAVSNHIFLKPLGATTLNSPQTSAALSAVPDLATGYSDKDAFDAFHNLSKADYDALPKVFQESIDARLALSPGPAQQILEARFHPQAPSAPAATPAGVTPTTAQANVPPNVQEALDVLYGTNPKAHTMAAQLKAYGNLRGSDFNAFNVQEQQQLLADLSFIATTAKGPSGDKARKLIDRFTPPGTPSGQTPGNPAIIPPATSVPGQVRYPTPQVGTLVMAKDKGKGGDGWITTPGGKRVWGKYGAAGLLLMHRDPGTGEKRYLMVQRGPGISDPGKWQFPGGAIDEKETFHQGGAREVIEELGFKADDLKSAAVVGEHTNQLPGSNWKYVSIAAEVPSMLKPDLSSHHARLETSDAKWMTEAEIKALDTSGKLLAPLAGGKLEQNVMSLFPASAPSGTGKLGQVARPGPVTRRQKRLTMPSGGRQSPASFNAWPHAHKPSTGKNLIPDKATLDAQRQKIKQDRKLYDGKTADGRLAAIGAQQGFDDTPTVLDRKEIDRLLATGDYIEAWRGVSGAGGWSARSRGGSGGKTAEQINEEMRSGPAYYGKGIFGNGYYLATQKSVARQYSDGSPGSLVRILIPKSAVMQKYDKVAQEAGSRSSRTSKAKGAAYGETSTFWDPGRYAAAIGVDGIVIEPHHISPGGGARHVAATGKPAYNWLNRSVLILQKEPG